MRDRVVTLAGYVQSYLAKWRAERVVSRVTGVKAIAHDHGRSRRQQGNSPRSHRSFAERRDAERAARNAPGITDVDNKLTVGPSMYAAV